MATLLLLYLLVGVFFYFGQELFFFHPTPLKKEHRFTFTQPFQEWNVATGGENLSILRFPTVRPAKGIVLFYHGNMRNVEHYATYPQLFTSRGWEVWMIDYPGFGKTTGKRSEERMYRDALLMYDLAAKRVNPEAIYVYGKSIGTGVAAHVAAQRQCRGLMLETPYYSIPSLAAHYLPLYPADWLTRYKFPTHANLPEVKGHVTIFHGTRDEVIPYRQAQRLWDENKRARFITMEGGRHNNLATFPIYLKTLDSLLLF